MPSPLSHFELMTNNPETCKAFYGKVFDWQFDDKTMPGYSLVNTGGEPSGGVFKKPETAPGVCVNVYFHVDDINSTLAKVGEHGGTVLVPKTAIPGVGHFAMFSDPEGIPIGIMQPTS